MRTNKIFSDMFEVTVRYADYLLNEQRTCSPALAKRISDSLGISPMVILFPGERQGKTLLEILKPKLEAAYQAGRDLQPHE